MTKDQATKRPWENNIKDFICANDKDNTPICRMFSETGSLYPNSEANARLIVKAVNCQDELMKALQAIETDSNNPECTMENIRFIVDTLIRPALAKGGAS